MCLKIGGYVRQQIGWNLNGSLTNGPLNGNVNTRATDNYTWRTRGYITADARNQTEYGTVRSYIAVGTNTDNAGGGTFSSNRAFIQFAGFTFGLSQSFYDFYSGPATSFFGGKINPSEDTGDAGQVVTAYTAQFGNGLSASIAAEASRKVTVINTTSTSLSTIALDGSSQKGQTFPDVVANLRVDQPWGAAQIMGAIHDVSGQYYTPATAASGHPGDKIGWAIGAGVKFLTPFISPGDYFQAEVNYTEGASAYTSAGTAIKYSSYDGGLGGKYAYGIMSDSVYGGTIAAGTATDIQLTTTWNVNAAYEHFWNKSWQTSLYGGYSATSYNSTANALLCANTGILTAAPTPAAGCNNNWQLWNIGTRTQWNIDSQTAMGVDIVYQKLETASEGLTTSVAGSGAQPTASRTMTDRGEFFGQFRIHRNFYP
jgi:hypothetical protein